MGAAEWTPEKWAGAPCGCLACQVTAKAKAIGSEGVRSRIGKRPPSAGRRPRYRREMWF